MKRKAPEKPKRPVKPVFHAVQDHEIQLDADRWSGFRDSFGEREVGIDADGSPIELLRLVREFTPVEQAIADRVSRLAAADLSGIAKALRLEHDDQKRRPRLVLVSERIAGIRLSEAIVRGISRAVVPDIGAALHVMRRLFATAESLHAATGVPHLIIAPERLILTPRADVVLTEAALGGATEALAMLPKALRLALSNVNGREEGHRVDIARIARIGMSMMLGRLLDPNETVDALSPALNEIAEVASIRANEVFASALRTWIEQAVTIDAEVSFKSFRQAGEALAWTEPPKDCAPSRRTLKTFLNDLALEDFRSPDMVALETERIHAIRARQTQSRPLKTTHSVWDALAPELGLAPKDEILQESLDEIESKPLNPPAEERSETEEEERGADEIDMSEALAEIGVEAEPAIAAVDEAGVFEISDPIGDLSFESFELASVPASRAVAEGPPEPPLLPPVQTAAPPPAAPDADVKLRAVASRFGFLLREEPGKRKPIVDPTARVAIEAATPVAFEKEAPPTSVAEPPETPLVLEPTAIEEPVVLSTPVEWPLQVAATPDVEGPSRLALADPEYDKPEYHEPAPSEEPVAAGQDQTPWTPPLVVIAEPPPLKRPKRSWFRAVADQFGMGDQAEATEGAAALRPADDAVVEEAAIEDAQWFAEAEADRAAAEVEERDVAIEAKRVADEAEGRRMSGLEAWRAVDAEARHQAEEEARRAVDIAARSAAEAEARRLAEEDGRRLAEAQARAEARRIVDEEEAHHQAAELEARRHAAEVEARRVAEEETRQLMAEAEERRRAEEDARQLAAEADARRRAVDEAKRREEAEARQRAEEEARSHAEIEAHRLAAVAEARRLEEEEAERRAAAEARQRAEEDARRRAEEEARRLAAEAEARRRAEEEAKRRAEAEARQRAEQEATRRAEEEARRLAAETEARRREAEARERAEQEARRRAEDQARHVAAEAEVRRLAAIAEAETRRLEAEGAARQAAAQAEAQRLAAAAAQQLADENAKIEAAELVEAASRAVWVNSMASELGLKDKTPAEPDSSWAPTPMPEPAAAAPPPVSAPQSASEWHASAPAASTWETPSPASQVQGAWQRADSAAPYPQASEPGRSDPIPAIESAVAFEPTSKPAREWKGPSRLPEIAAAVSQMLRSAALLVVAAGLVGGLSWAGYSYYTSKFVPGTVVIESTPAAAEILIDGAAKGVTPLTIELPPGKHKLELRRRGNSREITLDIAAGEQLRQQIDLTNLRAIGILVVNSSPKGATVSIDGRERGVTPLTLNDVDAGAHSVLIESSAGSIQKNVQIVAGGKVTLDEGIFSGWIKVFAPFELQIFERKRLVGTTNDSFMLSAGRHELEFVNKQRGFRDTRVVEVGPGATVPVNILESETEGIVRIDAPPGTEVFVDGKLVGESPIAEQHLPVGAREILAKHPQFGETKTTATVNSSRPVDVKIEFASQP